MNSLSYLHDRESFVLVVKINHLMEQVFRTKTTITAVEFFHVDLKIIPRVSFYSKFISFESIILIFDVIS